MEQEIALNAFRTSLFEKESDSSCLINQILVDVKENLERILKEIKSTENCTPKKSSEKTSNLDALSSYRALLNVIKKQKIFFINEPKVLQWREEANFREYQKEIRRKSKPEETFGLRWRLNTLFTDGLIGISFKISDDLDTSIWVTQRDL